MTDSLLSQWLHEASRGDDEAFRKLVAATRDQLYWTARRMVGRDAVAEEILQEAYMALWDGAAGRGVQNPMAWLRKSVVNRSIDHLRREEVRRPHSEVEEEAIAAPAAGLPEAALGSREAEERIQDALLGLPPRMRAAILMKAEGYDYAEIAASLGTAESTVRNHVLQARARLGPVLER